MIDAHVHFWRLARAVNEALTPEMAPIYRDLEPEHLRPLLDRNRIRAVMAVQASWTLGENLFMLGLAERFDWIAGVVGWVDLASPSLAEEAAALRRMPRMRGLRPVRRDDNRDIGWMAGPEAAPGWAALAETGLVLDLLVQDWRQLPLLEPLVARHPETAFVLDHCGKPDIPGRRFDEWAASITKLARHGNLCCKYSGLSQSEDTESIRPFSDHVITAFGPDRLIWASDWPPLQLASNYDLWCAQTDELLVGLSVDERRALRAGTAQRVYGLGSAFTDELEAPRGRGPSGVPG